MVLIPHACAAARRTERRHPHHIYLYTINNKPKSYQLLSHQLSSITDYCCASAPEGNKLTGGAGCARFEGKELVVTVNGKELRLNEKQLTIDGSCYDNDGFYDISTF